MRPRAGSWETASLMVEHKEPGSKRDRKVGFGAAQVGRFEVGYKTLNRSGMSSGDFDELKKSVKHLWDCVWNAGGDVD